MTKNINDLTISLFKVCLTSAKTNDYYLGLVDYGIVTDFLPSPAQEQHLKASSKPLNVTTLFSVEERENGSIEYLLSKQILHYIEVYGLNTPGLFNLENDGGTKFTFTFIKGVTEDELEEKIQSLIYANKPIKNVDDVYDLIKSTNVTYNVNKIKNNEIKMKLFDPVKDVFANGDDLVRYMVYVATGNTLLIKSREVIESVKNSAGRFTPMFFERNSVALAHVFNRHKKIILAAKCNRNRSSINFISRQSKKLHIPVKEAVAKRVIADYCADKIKDSDLNKVLGTMSVRDKFKVLNTIRFRKSKASHDAFVVRNGKIFTKKRTDHSPKEKLDKLEYSIYDYLLSHDFIHLVGKKIILDEQVDYGLPISAKQTVGNLPFGTTFELDENDTENLSVGIHWRNNWGARDLDLSAIDANGRRVGWGGYSGYSRNDLMFSGDVVDAINGAMEFFTVDKSPSFGLFVNIFSGADGSKCEIVVGKKGSKSKQWIDDVIIREKTKLNSKGSIIGFYQEGKFVVYQGRLNNKIANFSDGGNPILEKNKSSLLTVEELFDKLRIEYDYEAKKDVEYDYDLRYKGFTIDKLEDMLLTK